MAASSAPRTVPSTFPEGRKASIAFVGEAPGPEELAKGEPLVGPAGRIFNGILRSAGLDRKEFFITNVFDEMAEDDDTTEFRRDEARVERAFKRLAEELREVAPTVIVPLGVTALWAFTGWSNITPFRGSVMKATRILTGAKLLPTFHPSHVMRQWKFLPIVMADVVKAAREVESGPEIVYPKKEIIIAPTLAEVEAYAEECLSSDLLSLDIETGWGQITCFGAALSATKTMCIPFVDVYHPTGSYWRTPQEEFRAWRAVQKICECPVPKLGQNFLYDFTWLWQKAGIGVRNYREDIRLMHHALYPELPKDLASMAGNYTRIGAYKHLGGRWQSDKKDA